MWNLKKNDTNKLIYKTESRFTDIENKLMVTKEKGGGEGGIRSLGLRDTHYYIKNKQQGPTGKYIQYLVMTYNGKECGKEYLYI